MSWEFIRTVGLLMFICGGMVVFAVMLGRFFDPPEPDAWIRIIIDSWMRSVGDGLMIIGACVALIGIAASTNQQIAGALLPQ
jgi:hypothetical protein